VQDWIRDLPYSSGEKVTGLSSRLPNAKAVATAECAKRDAELRARFVVVPTGDEAKHVTCPICKEVFKSEFNEDDEEWIWKDALKIEDKACLTYKRFKCDIDLGLTDLSRNMSCRSSGYQRFAHSSSASGLYRQPLWDA
jgi:hypothetical protein